MNLIVIFAYALLNLESEYASTILIVSPVAATVPAIPYRNVVIMMLVIVEAYDLIDVLSHSIKTLYDIIICYHDILKIY